MGEILDYVCATLITPPGGYRVTATVDGRPVAGWVNVYQPTLTPSVAANLIAAAERAHG